MPLVINGPYCFGCGGSRVVRRYFWTTVAWDTGGKHEGWVERAVCLDCDGNIGEPVMIFGPGTPATNDERSNGRRTGDKR